MDTWLSYAAEDFLLFSAEVYWRLFMQANAALWPLPVIAPIVALAVLEATRRHPLRGGRALLALLALGWIGAGWVFVRTLYAPVNWAAGALAPVFMVEAALLAAASARRPADTGVSRGAGTALVALAALYPVAAILLGRPVATAEVVGIAPDPTAVATLGASLLAAPPRWRLALGAIPALWLGQSALTLALLDPPAAALPVAVLGLWSGAMIAGARRR
jgi:hypothetical protein